MWNSGAHSHPSRRGVHVVRLPDRCSGFLTLHSCVPQDNQPAQQPTSCSGTTPAASTGIEPAKGKNVVMLMKPDQHPHFDCHLSCLRGAKYTSTNQAWEWSFDKVDNERTAPVQCALIASQPVSRALCPRVMVRLCRVSVMVKPAMMSSTATPGAALCW